MGGHLIGPEKHNQMGIQLCLKNTITSCVFKVGGKTLLFFIINRMFIELHFKGTFKIVSQR